MWNYVQIENLEEEAKMYQKKLEDTLEQIRVLKSPKEVTVSDVQVETNLFQRRELEIVV